VTLESVVYGAVTGVLLALVFSWLSGRPLSFRDPRRIRILNVLTVVVAVAVPQLTEAAGLGYGPGVVLLLTAVAVIYGWRHFRPPRADSAQRRPS